MKYFKSEKGKEIYQYYYRNFSTQGLLKYSIFTPNVFLRSDWEYRQHFHIPFAVYQELYDYNNNLLLGEEQGNWKTLCLAITQE
jgi:plasmid rolling circle replication initiator protein Rep